MGDLISQFDWCRTSIGPLEFWPQSLKTTVSIILNSSHPMWIGWGKEMNFLYNDAYVQVLGLSKHPWALGKKAEEVWKEIWDFCGPKAGKVFDEGEGCFFDETHLFMDRGEFVEETFYSFSYSPIRDESGQVGGLFCPSSEITAKVLNTRRLRTLSELAATALEKTIDTACASAAHTLAGNKQDIPFALLYLVSGVDGEAILTQTVNLHKDIPGISPSVIKWNDGHTIWPVMEVMQNGSTRTVSIQDASLLPSGPAGHPVREAIIVPVTAPGQQRPIAILIAGISPNQRLDPEYRTFFQLMSQQIGTAIQNAQALEEERKRMEDMAALDRAKTVFFNNISHEFRTPLTLMLGPLDDLLANPEYGLNGRTREIVSLSHRNALRMLKLVNNLLDFSRIEAGRMMTRLEATELGTFTRDITSGFRSAIEKEGIVYNVDCGSLSQEVNVDRDMWEKIVLNLVSNAYKYTIKGEISVHLKEEAGVVRLLVRDTGVGISAAELPRVFDRFHRVENTRGRTFEGSGIGLALVKELVKLHDGAITVSSEPDKGSLFEVTIPFRGRPGQVLDGARLSSPDGASRPRDRRNAEFFISEASRWSLEEAVDGTLRVSGPPVDDGLAAAIDGTAMGEGTSPEKKRILLADDNADMRMYITKLLSDEFDVVSVPDGEAAWIHTQENSYDLVLADIMMPKLNGFELLKKIRSQRATSHLPVIFLSGRAGEEAILEGLEAGADDYLVKPFSGRELRARVSNHIMINAIRREVERALIELANAMPQLVWVADAAGKVVYYNNRILQMAGVHQQQAESWEWKDIVHPDDLGLSAKGWSTALETAGVYEREHRFLMTDGSYHWFLSRAVPQFDEQGRLEKWVGTATDIDTIKKLQQQKDDFLKIASHELKTPITSIKASIQFLLEQCRSEEGIGEMLSAGMMKPVLAIVDKQIRKLTKLLSELLDISRVESGRLLMNPTRFDLQELITELRVDITHIHPDYIIAVHNQATETWLEADKDKMVQVLTNLLINAIKYSPDSPIIEMLLLNPSPKEIQVRITDHGIGIDTKDQERIFERFYRVEGDDEKAYSGFGIGLYLAKEIVEQHGGMITVASKKGEGSVFSVTMPLWAKTF